MENKKNIKVEESAVLATGIYKKRVWPWLLIIGSILLVGAFVAFIAVEFSNDPKCNNHVCSSFLKYATHYNVPLMIACALVVVSVIIVILFTNKRYLTVTTTALSFKKGNKNVELPIKFIEKIDTGSSSLIVSIPYVTLKIAKLKNKKEVYDAIMKQKMANNIVAEASAPIPAKAMSNTEGKLAYFKKLYNSNLITREQYEKYVSKSLKADSLIV